MHLLFAQQNQYLNHVANFQSRFVAYVASYSNQQQLQLLTNSDIYQAHFGDHHFPKVLSRILRQLAKVLDVAQLQQQGKIHLVQFQLVACSLGQSIFTK